MRWLYLAAPWPDGWTKHSRVGTTRQGRRFLVPEARAYRALVIAAVRPVLPRRPWFDATRRWDYVYIEHTGGRDTDHDQHSGGVLDDVIEAGLAKDDGEARLSAHEFEREGPAGVWLYAWQRGHA